MIVEDGKTLKFERVTNIGVEDLFDAWSKPEIFRTWWKDLKVAEMDFRVGGSYKLQWIQDPADAAVGEYKTIEPGKKIVFTWNTNGKEVTNSLITLNFVSLGNGKSKLELVHEFLITEADRDSHYHGWTCALLDFDKYYNAASRDGLKAQAVEVSRFMPFPADTVFKAVTTPQFMNQWFNRTGAKLGKAEADLKVGGSFRMDYETKDGILMPHYGEYLEIVPNEKLVFTWTSDNCHYESKVTLSLIAKKDGTEVRINHENLFSEEYRKDHQSGWTACLRSIEEELSKL